MEKTTQQKVLGTLAGIAVIALGIATLARPTLSLEVVVLFICAGLLIMAVMNLLKVLLKWHEHKLWQIVEAFLNVAFATVIFLLRTRLQGMIPDIFALWILLNSVVRLISSYIYFRDGVPNYGAYFVNGIFTLAIGILLLVNNRFKFFTFSLVAGIYVIWYGITMIIDTLNEEETQLKMSHAAKSVQRRLRIAIPGLVGALLPRKLLQNYDDKVASEDANAFLLSQNVKKSEAASLHPYNVEILVHLAKSFMESFGHVDLILGDEAIAYGNFDGHSYRLGGAISDGILFRCNRERYLQQSVYTDHKVLYSFKVAFDEEELAQIRRNFDAMHENMIPWYCDTQLMEQGLLPPGDYNDIADKIYKGNDARFYKFKRGQLRTYFAVDTNCVKVADSIFEGTDFDKPAIPGIVTPGAYYQFLTKELERSGSKVYEKVLYSKETLKKQEK